ncbi:MAG TPA: type IV pilus assembly protein PilM [Jatrophihabitans sp.]|nr:type IV pilus assembly protein PilM [Jatrophihabitans sp.]
MKHRQTGISKVGLINPDGHAIGLDLGATSARAAILAPGTHEGRPSVTVHGIGHVDLPPGAVTNGIVVDQPAVTAALKQLWQQQRFECRNVILGITNQQVVVRDMTVPNLPPDQQAKALPFQAREIVALPMDQVLLDFARLGEVNTETDTVDGLLIATPRVPVLAAVTTVERAGLKVARVDLSTFAALRSIAHEQLSVEAVIDLGAHLTNIVIHNQGIPKVVRTVPRGGQELTDRLIDDLELSVPDAERAKAENGLTGPHRQVAKVIGEGIRPLLAEIRSSIHYFSSTNDGAQLERISLTGGASGLPGLAAALADQMGVPTNVVTPMQHIRNRWASKQAQSEEADGSASAVSVGLAMGAAA